MAAVLFLKLGPGGDSKGPEALDPESWLGKGPAIGGDQAKPRPSKQAQNVTPASGKMQDHGLIQLAPGMGVLAVLVLSSLRL